jgi:hypothetical protein
MHPRPAPSLWSGSALTLNDTIYARTFGTRTGSELRFSLKGTNATCTPFISRTSVDDEVGNTADFHAHPAPNFALAQDYGQ